jgi:hypothetical protein
MIPNALPPRGIFVPTTLIFHADLPPAPLRTWMQLRCLAWTGWSTPPLTVAELASHLGIHPARLSRHLAQLKDSLALSWRIAGNEKIIITFPEKFTGLQDGQGDTQSYAKPVTHTIERPETHNSASYFPAKILGYLSYEDDAPENQTNDEIFIPQSYPQFAASWERPEQPTSDTA